MIVDIRCEALQPQRLPDDDLHRTHRLLAGFDILLRRPVFCALGIVRFDLSNLLTVKEDFRNTRMVLDRHRQPVGNGLVHRIAVDLVAKRLVGFGYRSAGKTYKSSVWKRLAEHLCVWLRYHRPHVCVGIFTELDFLGMLKLRPMSLVREANDIRPVVDQSDLVVLPVAKLLYGADVEATAFARTQFLTQFLPARHDADFAKVQEFRAPGEELRTLLLQIVAVNDHDNRRRTYFLHVTAPQGKLPRQKCHRICLAAPRGPEIRPAFPAFLLNRLDNALTEQTSGEELWIAADNLHLVAVVVAILKIDVIPEYLKKPHRAIDALDHRRSLFKRQR